MESGEYAQLESKWFGNTFEKLINKLFNIGQLNFYKPLPKLFK